MSDYSEVTWLPSPPAFSGLIQYLSTEKDPQLEVGVAVTRPAPPNAQSVTGTFQSVLARKDVNALRQLLLNLNSTSEFVILPDLVCLNPNDPLYFAAIL